MDKEKINIIMICVRTQMFTNNHRLLGNSPSWPQFKIGSADRGCISFPVHISFVYSKKNKKQAVFHLLTEYSICLFIDPT